MQRVSRPAKKRGDVSSSSDTAKQIHHLVSSLRKHIQESGSLGAIPRGYSKKEVDAWHKAREETKTLLVDLSSFLASWIQVDFGVDQKSSIEFSLLFDRAHQEACGKGRGWKRRKAKEEIEAMVKEAQLCLRYADFRIETKERMEEANIPGKLFMQVHPEPSWNPHRGTCFELFLQEIEIHVLHLQF